VAVHYLIVQMYHHRGTGRVALELRQRRLIAHSLKYDVAIVSGRDHNEIVFVLLIAIDWVLKVQ